MDLTRVSAPESIQLCKWNWQGLPKTYDLIVTGAGLLGLWVARMAQRRGLTVLVIEAGQAAASGASATPLAALLPHFPDRFDEKKRFQLAALAQLEAEIATLQTETGLPTGYVRRGRVIPIRKPSFHAKAQAAEIGAKTHWAGTPYTCHFREAGEIPGLDGWLSPDAAPLGMLHDTLSASVDGAAYMRAMVVATSAVCDIRFQTTITRWETSSHTAYDPDGSAIARADACVIAAGHRSFQILDRLLPGPAGDGVKGHAAVFRLPQSIDAIATRPVLYEGGIYVVPADAQTLAVGSTTEFHWTDDTPDEAAATDMIARAKALCPALAGAERTSLWAGIRPRAATRNPLIGAVPGQPGLFVATGGYKITFGIAHRLAACLVDEIISGSPSAELPGTFHAHRALGERQHSAP